MPCKGAFLARQLSQTAGVAELRRGFGDSSALKDDPKAGCVIVYLYFPRPHGKMQRVVIRIQQDKTCHGYLYTRST